MRGCSVELHRTARENALDVRATLWYSAKQARAFATESWAPSFLLSEDEPDANLKEGLPMSPRPSHLTSARLAVSLLVVLFFLVGLSVSAFSQSLSPYEEVMNTETLPGATLYRHSESGLVRSLLGTFSLLEQTDNGTTGPVFRWPLTTTSRPRPTT